MINTKMLGTLYTYALGPYFVIIRKIFVPGLIALLKLFVLLKTKNTF